MRLSLRISISLALIGFICWRLDWGTAAQQVADQASIWLLAAAAVVTGQIAIAALRWRIILRALGIYISAKSVLSITYIAAFFNSWFLGTISGDLARAALAPHSDKGRAAIVHSVILDRVMTLCGLSFGILPGIVVGAGPLTQREWLPAELAAALIPLAALFLAAPIAEFLGSFRLSVAHHAKEVAESWRRLMRARSHFAAALALSALAGVAISLIAWCLGRAQHLDVPLVGFLMLMPPVVLLTALPISVGGWGIRESALVYGLGVLGVGASAATVLSVEMGTLVALLSLPGGGVWLWGYRARIRPEQFVPAAATPSLANR